jgi:hypothetical protein
MVKTEAQGVSQGKGDPILGTVFRPIGLGKKGKYLINLQLGRVRADDKSIFEVFLVVHGSFP